MNYIFFPSTALCGASGVVFAFILLSSFTNFKEGELPLTFVLVAVFFIGQQIWEGITVQDNISNMAHIVGGIIGGILGYGLNKKDRFIRQKSGAVFYSPLIIHSMKRHLIPFLCQ